ncbi:MAG: excinuclease ABC subunit UvrA [Bacteroidales bacterium]|nr:excinuclease ABC subunit UvrA [Bacteroidales bacterium]
MADQEYITITGARVNNLKNISLKIPRGKLCVVTGVSGSGKSSLAFDTLYAEGQRRFAESLSSFARQFLGRMSKPDVDKIEGIPPAIAIQQRTSSRNPRSTVGTSTEIYDYLRILYTKIGVTYSPVSGCEVKKETVEDVASFIGSLEKGTAVYILVKIAEDEKHLVEKLIDLKQQGFTRLFEGGQVKKIDQFLKEGRKSDELYFVVSRLIHDGSEDMSEVRGSAETAFSLGEGRIVLAYNLNDKISYRRFSNIFEADGMVFEEPSEAMFSFNNPLGACPECGGFGSMIGIDEKLVIPNASLSVYEDAVAPWRGKLMGWYKEKLIDNAYKFDFPVHRPYAMLTQAQKDLLWNGNSYFTGINDFFAWVETKKYKIQFRYMLSRYSGRSVCRACGGTRLKKETNYVKIGGKSIGELLDMDVSSLLKFLKSLKLSKYQKEIGGRALKEITQRLEYIEDVGLGYLTLSRHSNTLSGGESQRINLVSSLGSSLAGSLYILDEPSIGLHPRDTHRLIGVMRKLRDLGNTIVVVEHDRDIIQAADHLIDIGPLAGAFGGEVVFEGNAAEGRKFRGSLTLDYINGRRKVNTGHKPRAWSRKITVEGAMEHNLKDITVDFPLNTFTVVSGVSGSGKSSLVGDILYPALCRHFQIGSSQAPGAFRRLSGDLSKISGVEYVDQNPMGKNARSNPVTYLKIYDDIRKLFSDQPYAKMNGYTNSYFSFNIDGGRCPVCLGEGYITVPMQFMADVKMVCEECHGHRFKQDILEVRYHGKNIDQVLDMSVDAAVEFFSSQKEPAAKKVVEGLNILQRVGLGYVKLGQSCSTLSGGESQRVMLAQFLSKDLGNSRQDKVFIFDEPTTGLHFNDVKKLLDALNALVDAGNTVIVVEHNTDVIKAADWIIDLGPDSGDKGGEVVFTGTPDLLAQDPRWGSYLQ